MGSKEYLLNYVGIFVLKFVPPKQEKSKKSLTSLMKEERSWLPGYNIETAH